MFHPKPETFTLSMLPARLQVACTAFFEKARSSEVFSSAIQARRFRVDPCLGGD